MPRFSLISLFLVIFVAPLLAQENFLRTPGDAAATSYAPVEILDAQMQRAVSDLTSLMAAGEVAWEQNAPAVHRLGAEVAHSRRSAGCTTSTPNTKWRLPESFCPPLR